MKRTLFAAGLLAASTGFAAAHDTTPLEREMARQAQSIEESRRLGDLTESELRQLQDEQSRIAWMLEQAQSDGSVTSTEYHSVEDALAEAKQNIATEARNPHVAEWRVRSSDGNGSDYNYERPRHNRWGFGRWGWGGGRWGHGRNSQDTY